MNFLNAKTVRLTRYYYNRSVSQPVYTAEMTEQSIWIDMKNDEGIQKVELSVGFGKDNKVPTKLSISAVQYTMNPFVIEMDCIKRVGMKPYQTVNLNDLRTIVEIEPNTNKIVFRFHIDKNFGKVAKIRFSINYYEY